MSEVKRVPPMPYHIDPCPGCEQLQSQVDELLECVMELVEHTECNCHLFAGTMCKHCATRAKALALIGVEQ